MIGLDTNVLLRYLTGDDPVQSVKAARLIEGSLSPGNPGFVSTVVVAEIAWVLRRTFRRPELETASVIERLIATDSIIVERESCVAEALARTMEDRAPFTDGLIAALGRNAGCSHTVTFDRKALRLPGFAPV